MSATKLKEQSRRQQRRAMPRRGKRRVQWYSLRDGTIRQEWKQTHMEAMARVQRLWRGHINARIYEEQAA